MFEFTGKLINPQSALWYMGVIAPKAIMDKIKSMENQRFIITINGSESFPGTPVPIETGKHLVLINKARQKKLKVVPGDDLHIKMIEDKSEFGMPMPEEMQEVMLSDPEGEAFLRALTPGKIRSLIYMVAKVKNVDKRIEKSIVIFEHLRINKGKLDYKMLNQAFKDFNQRF